MMYYFMLAGAWPKHTQLGPSTLSNCQQTMRVINENKKKGNKGYCLHYLKSIVTRKQSVSVEYSNMPTQWALTSNESQHLDESFMFGGLKSLHEDISYLVSHWNVLQFDASFFNMFSYIMLVNMDMFHARVECWIDCKRQSALIVT